MSWSMMTAPLRARANPTVHRVAVQRLRAGLLNVSPAQIEAVDFPALVQMTLLGADVHPFPGYPVVRTVNTGGLWMVLRDPARGGARNRVSLDDLPAHDRVERFIDWADHAIVFTDLKTYAEAVLNYGGTRLHRGIWDILEQHLDPGDLAAHHTMHALGATVVLPQRLADL